MLVAILKNFEPNPTVSFVSNETVKRHFICLINIFEILQMNQYTEIIHYLHEYLMAHYLNNIISKDIY
jgi:hypothetical protein